MSGPRVLVVQHEDDVPTGWIGTWLHDAGAELDVRRPYADGSLPDDLADHDALLVLGGRMGATDDEHPWLAPTRDLIARAAAEEVPTLGICLGHQLCAVALGGRIDRNPAGQQLGVLDVGWAPDADADELVGTLVDTARAVHWNNDVVAVLPPGAVVLASAEGGEAQVVRYTPTVWGVQMHPEVDEEIVATWATGGDREVQGDAVIDGALAEIAGARDELLAGWAPLAAAFVALTRRPDA